jgi:hypothetical protein
LSWELSVACLGKGARAYELTIGRKCVVPIIIEEMLESHNSNTDTEIFSSRACNANPPMIGKMMMDERD